MLQAIKRVLALLGFLRDDRSDPGGHDHDPYAWRPVPRTPAPKGRQGAVAVAEPDE